jgi:hypothetical protein
MLMGEKLVVSLKRVTAQNAFELLATIAFIISRFQKLPSKPGAGGSRL